MKLLPGVRATPGAPSLRAAAILAVDPAGLGGLVLRAPAGHERDAWLEALRGCLPSGAPCVRVPAAVGESALLGGLDLVASLARGQPVVQSGVLERADGGLLLLAMAERLSMGTAASLSSVLDSHELVLERDGLARRIPVRLGVVAFDEGREDDERPPPALLERLALMPEWGPGDPAEGECDWDAQDVARAREHLSEVETDEESVSALCAAALALGVDSVRASLQAVRVARVAAALDGRPRPEAAHLALAARLVLAPRATQVPAPPPAEETPEEAPPEPEETSSPEHQDTPPPEPPAPPEDSELNPEADEEPPPEEPALSAQELEEAVIAAAAAAIPPGLLAALRAGQDLRRGARASGRAGAEQKSRLRGRPVGVRRGDPRTGARLHLLETLRAAAPWQPLRRQLPSAAAPESGRATPRVRILREDFRVRQYRNRRPTTTVFVVDASGSSALHRLAEAKGAVELMLAECHIRRDRVAVLAFRGKGTELLLPATRSLARAKRSLAGLPGGGGTPLASALEASRELCDQLGRQGDSAVVVLLTDGRANIALDGSPGRPRAMEDALAAARAFQATPHHALLVDTSPQPQGSARQLARTLGAHYVPLPQADAARLSQAVRLATSPTGVR